jgi:hypothetical protein
MSMTEKLETEWHGVVSRTAFDPYLYRAEMPLTAVFYPLGFPLELATNSRKVVDAAEESWGFFQKQFETPPLALNIGVLEDGSTKCPEALVPRSQRGLMVQVADCDNFYVSDFLQGFMFGWINSAAASRTGYLRFHFLEPAVLFQIANRFTVGMHAGCVELDGRGVLLCGESGAGKSSLSFACARAGWTYITDDASFLVQGRDDRMVTGNCHIVRLRPSASELFHEAAGRPITPRASGKPTVEIRTSDIGEITGSHLTKIDYIVFLNRADASAQGLVRYPKESARRYLYKHVSDVEKLRERQVTLLEKLLDVEIFELHYRDLNQAIDQLERLVRGKI